MSVRQTGHKTLETLRRYVRTGEIFRENAAARLGIRRRRQCPGKTVPRGLADLLNIDEGWPGRLPARKRETATSEWVFPGDAIEKPLFGISLAHTHTMVCRPGTRKEQKFPFPKEFVLHSPRRACLTRLREAGTDAFTIMRLAGHSSITISQRYVHPTGETIELAVDRLETLNQKALEASSDSK